MKRNYVLIFVLLLTPAIYGQAGTPFDKGFYEGYAATMIEAGYGGYTSGGDPRECGLSANSTAATENADKEGYARGYRCGTLQASKSIPQIKERLQKEGEQRLKENIEDPDKNAGSQRAALFAQKLANEQNEENKRTIEESKNRMLQQEISDASSNAVRRNVNDVYGQQDLQHMRDKQIQAQLDYNQQMANSLTSMTSGIRSSLQVMMINNIKKELSRRQNIANDFADENSARIQRVSNLYDRIPAANFEKVLNGQFGGHIFVENNYSFANNQKFVTEVPGVVKVVDNRITAIYPYGKEGFGLDFPDKMPESSFLSNGIVKYTDFETLETVTVVLLEPYLTDSPKQYQVKKDGTGFLTVWTKKKKDAGKIIYVQELDDKGNIFRETSTILVYAKNEKKLQEMDVQSVPVSDESTIHYFCEIVETPMGTFPLYPKTSKSDSKPLDSGENRLVQIKKYRGQQ